jgi:pilus assembly protein Flp/PilA
MVTGLGRRRWGAFPPNSKRRSKQVLELRSRIFTFALDEDGQALVEYSLILLLIALVTITALTSIGTTVSGILTTVANAL